MVEDSPSAVRTDGQGVKWWPAKSGHYTRGHKSLLHSFEYMVCMAPPGV